ncbi:DUF1642 domain-containing protein [Lacticaseibacillus paracasei]|uniref:DUF1642 domain-containing protein n=1 Tax=Lacticaseibacillus paracasei TaxID=1597 RepID=UPI00192C08D1|nr:DUF1642 domain-containing protein [Lacticaseibacillus paracasei]CAD7482720.1 conserved hypothetical protein [Lacticaseibacillus paracasei]
MSEEKMYAVKNDEGKYLTIERTAPWWDSQVGTAVRNIDVALAWAGKHGGHVVTFVQKPKPELLTKEEDNALADPTNNSLASAISKYVHEQCNKCESVDPDILELKLMRALVNGYTVAKEKKYNVKVPHVPLYYWKKSDGVLGIDDLNAADDDTDTDDFEFTEREISDFSLQDCEKEEVTDDAD